ncbi:hypothetical protein D3C75_1382070 [compost metagenome]
MENRQSGAMAGVYYLSGQVEDSLLASAPRPVEQEEPVERVRQNKQEPLLIRLPP